MCMKNLGTFLHNLEFKSLTVDKQLFEEKLRKTGHSFYLCIFHQIYLLSMTDEITDIFYVLGSNDKRN